MNYATASVAEIAHDADKNAVRTDEAITELARRQGNDAIEKIAYLALCRPDPFNRVLNATTAIMDSLRQSQDIDRDMAFGKLERLGKRLINYTGNDENVETKLEELLKFAGEDKSGAAYDMLTELAGHSGSLARRIQALVIKIDPARAASLIGDSGLSAFRTPSEKIHALLEIKNPKSMELVESVVRDGISRNLPGAFDAMWDCRKQIAPIIVKLAEEDFEKLGHIYVKILHRIVNENPEIPEQEASHDDDLRLVRAKIVEIVAKFQSEIRSVRDRMRENDETLDMMEVESTVGRLMTLDLDAATDIVVMMGERHGINATQWIEKFVLPEQSHRPYAYAALQKLDTADSFQAILNGVSSDNEMVEAFPYVMNMENGDVKKIGDVLLNWDDAAEKLRPTLDTADKKVFEIARVMAGRWSEWEEVVLECLKKSPTTENIKSVLDNSLSHRYEVTGCIRTFVDIGTDDSLHAAAVLSRGNGAKGKAVAAFGLDAIAKSGHPKTAQELVYIGLTTKDPLPALEALIELKRTEKDPAASRALNEAMLPLIKHVADPGRLYKSLPHMGKERCSRLAKDFAAIDSLHVIEGAGPMYLTRLFESIVGNVEQKKRQAESHAQIFGGPPGQSPT